jgi:multidrug efflux pump subunit AcrA (membrane-fusion protein)
LAGSFNDAWRLETVAWVWLVMFAIITLHEFAHGLTCKHYGGQVHEVGFLLMYFMPCFYCNVSDAWLFREKSKRLWVTFAGGYFELFMWSLAVFAWRVTLPGTTVNYLAFIVLTVCGVQTLFNFNPLIKLDGYYMLSDWLEVPNLQQRSFSYFKEHLRWLLWGAPRPTSVPRAKALLRFGLLSWCYSLVFFAFMLWGMFWFLGDRWGVLGMSAVTLIGLVSTRSMLKDTSAGEARRMLFARHKRLTAWLAVMVAVIAALCLVKIDDRVSGQFRVRPAVRAELRAAVSGFVKAVRVDEGDRVSAGSVVAVLEIPDLASRIAEKQAEIHEAQAQLRLLEIGARPEQLAEQRERVVRATRWRDLGQQDLDRMRSALADELASLETKITACRAEFDVAQTSYQRAALLARRKTISAEEVQQKHGNFQVIQARLEQAESERRARQTRGTLEAEAELASRQHQLKDAESALKLLEAGSRPERIEAQPAQLTRLNEEANYLEQLRERLTICSRVAGIVVTPRLKEKIGQYVHEGDILGVVEEPTGADVEISLAEQDVARIQVGHTVTLKVRALPFETFQSKVERIAPAADQGEVQSTVVVYCGSGNLADDLRPGMTGYARVTTGRRPIGEVIIAHVLRYVRTEFWFCW